MVLVAYVLPKFETFFKSFDAKLPLPTRMLLSASGFVENWWSVLVLDTSSSSRSACFLYLRTERGKLCRDRILLRAPRARRRRALRGRSNGSSASSGSMLRAGVPVPDALAVGDRGARTTSCTSGRSTRRRAEVLRGEGLSRPLAATGLFPGAAAQMLRVGEESGTLDQQLELAADFYQGGARLQAQAAHVVVRACRHRDHGPHRRVRRDRARCPRCTGSSTR